jgi:hypothetical protein
MPAALRRLCRFGDRGRSGRVERVAAQRRRGPQALHLGVGARRGRDQGSCGRGCGSVLCVSVGARRRRLRRAMLTVVRLRSGAMGPVLRVGIARRRCRSMLHPGVRIACRCTVATVIRACAACRRRRAVLRVRVRRAGGALVRTRAGAVAHRGVIDVARRGMTAVVRRSTCRCSVIHAGVRVRARSVGRMIHGGRRPVGAVIHPRGRRGGRRSAVIVAATHGRPFRLRLAIGGCALRRHALLAAAGRADQRRREQSYS